MNAWTNINYKYKCVVLFIDCVVKKIIFKKLKNIQKKRLGNFLNNLKQLEKFNIKL